MSVQTNIPSARAYLAGFAALLLCDTAAQLCFKLAALDAAPLAADLTWLARVFGEPWVYGAIAAYVGGFLAWMGLLRQLPVGAAVAASHFEVVIVMLLSVPLFHEHISVSQWSGCALIVVGIAVLAVGESRGVSEHEPVH